MVIVSFDLNFNQHLIMNDIFKMFKYKIEMILHETTNATFSTDPTGNKIENAYCEIIT